MPSETASNRDPLSLFHPLVRRWFAERLGVPTDVQARAWPEIAAGRHVLVTAPTGSGKTLTAFRSRPRRANFSSRCGRLSI